MILRALSCFDAVRVADREGRRFRVIECLDSNLECSNSVSLASDQAESSNVAQNVDQYGASPQSKPCSLSRLLRATFRMSI